MRYKLLDYVKVNLLFLFICLYCFVSSLSKIKQKYKGFKFSYISVNGVRSCLYLTIEAIK